MGLILKLRITTTILDVIFMLYIMYSCKDLIRSKNKSAFVGFACMDMTFFLNLLLIWYSNR